MPTVDFFNQLHKKTTRDYAARMQDDKVHCMRVAGEYDRDYWDGPRRYGYGGYHYDGRWAGIAQALIKKYSLGPQSKILDIGCGKAHLLLELQKLLPTAQLTGIDISAYALDNAPDAIRSCLQRHDAREPLPWTDQAFDLVVSLNCLHNFNFTPMTQAVREIERVGISKYILVESYRNEQELFNLQCWALTARSFYSTEDWFALYNLCHYTGDCEFIFFE